MSAQNIDCRYSLEPPQRGGSNEYPQSMFLGRSKENNIYPYKPQFYYIKVGFKGVKLYRYVFVMSGPHSEPEHHPQGHFHCCTFIQFFVLYVFAFTIRHTCVPYVRDH